MKQDNNGQIKIESKEDLPPTGDYQTVTKNGYIRQSLRSSGFLNDNEYWLNNVTYYQPFSPREPEPPIY